jgi:hypothetical protein
MNTSKPDNTDKKNVEVARLEKILAIMLVLVTRVRITNSISY